MASTESSFKQFEKRIEALEDLDQNGESGFAREFQALRNMSFKYKAKGNTAYATKAGESAVNRPKNRFKDILPFDYSRVTLPSTGSDGSDYINANFVKGVRGEKVYIASQGPLPQTVNDFWRMLWAYKVKIVVMLCRDVENGKRKCQQYWCDTDDKEKLTFGDIVVKTDRCIGVGNDFMMRTLVAESKGEKLTITQFHYTAWPDHGVPPTTLPLIKLIKLVREYQPEDSPPIVVHCSAGCGRTGTICALDYTWCLLNEAKYKDIDPYRIVENLRKQRHAMVQTKGQYEFLCRAMCSLFRERLDLPIDEDHDDHLYENVVPRTPSSDSDSEMTPQSPVFFDKKDKVVAPKIEHKNNTGGVPQGSLSGPPNKRVGQISQQQPNDNYINVAFDLVDLSDGTSSPPPRSAGAAKPKNTNPAHSALLPNAGKAPLSRKVSAPEYRAQDTSSDYVIVPPRESSSKNDNRDTRSLPTAAKYENVEPVPQARPSTNNPPATSTKPTTGLSSAGSYENIEVPGHKPSTHSSTFPSDRTVRPATPEKSPTRGPYRRSASNSAEILGTQNQKAGQSKFVTVGAAFGAKLAGQVKAMEARRARVLPNEHLDPADADEIVPKESDKKMSGRRTMNRNTFRSADSVDGVRTQAHNKKSTELLNIDGIGFGKRLAKPVGPRLPPWKVER